LHTRILLHYPTRRTSDHTHRPGSRSRTTELTGPELCRLRGSRALGSAAQSPTVATAVDHLRQPDEGFAEAPDARSCARDRAQNRSEEHTSELQSRFELVC